MINEVKNNSEYGWFEIIHQNGKLSCFTHKTKFEININKDGGKQTDLSTYSLLELEKASLIILNAYLYSHEKLEQMVNENCSDQDLSHQKGLIILMRKVLGEILEYINSYDEKVIEKYRNI